MCKNFTQTLGKSSCTNAEALPRAPFQVRDLLENSSLKLFPLLASFIEDPFHCTRFYGMASLFFFFFDMNFKISFFFFFIFFIILC